MLPPAAESHQHRQNFPSVLACTVAFLEAEELEIEFCELLRAIADGLSIDENPSAYFPR